MIDKIINMLSITGKLSFSVRYKINFKHNIVFQGMLRFSPNEQLSNLVL